MIKPFNTEANNYTLYGALFGFLFPIGATILDSFNSYGFLSWTNILKTQSENSLIWIIDSAPFWLGLFARFGGANLDKLLEQKNMQLQKSEEKVNSLGRIMDNSSNEIYTFDASTLRFTQVNRGARKNLGYSMEELTFLTPLEIKPEYTEETFSNLIELLRMDTVPVLNFETVHKRKNGTLYPVEVHLELMKEESPPVFVAIIKDIFERKASEEKILSESKFASENPFPVMRVSNEGKFIFLNQAANIVCLKYDCQIDHKIPIEWQRYLAEVLSNNQTIEFDDYIEGKHYAFNMVPIQGMDYLNIYGLDITLRKEAEREIESFAAIASHDLQEPLRKINMFGERLIEKEKNLSVDSKEYLEKMQKSATRMKRFIEDLLKYSKISNQQLPFEKIDLEKKMKNVCKEMKHIIDSTNGVVNISKLPAIDGVGTHLNQLFTNLIMNAFKYKREGVAPVVNISGKDTGNGFLVITIEDNGIGFDEKYAERIFQPFERLHGRSVYEGSGLGLTICKRIVDQHNGDLSIKSKLGEGATFIIKFPKTQGKTN